MENLDLDFAKEQARSYVEIAGKGKRLFNIFVDTIAIVVLSLVIDYTIIMLVDHFNPESNLLYEYENGYGTWLDFLYYFVYFFYFVFFEFFNHGKTLGKMITRTRVITRDGSSPGVVKIIGRTISRFIPFDGLVLLFNSEGMSLHDSLSGTKVVED